MIVVYMNSLLVISVSRSASFSLSLRVWVGEVGGEGSDCDAQYKPFFFFCGNVFGDSYCCLYSNVSLILLFVHRLPDEGITCYLYLIPRMCRNNAIGHIMPFQSSHTFGRLRRHVANKEATASPTTSSFDRTTMAEWDSWKGWAIYFISFFLAVMYLEL